MRIIAILLISMISLGTQAQVKNPVKWTFSSKKIDAKTYELQLTATMDPKWHIYTIEHKGDIGVPTSITFNANPLGSLKGKVTANKKPVKLKDPSTGEMVAFYEGQVVFKQIVELKAPVKTNYTGTVEFMACDDKLCTPPTEKTFSISLQ